MNTPCKRKRFLPYLRSCILGLMLALSASGIALAQGTITDGDANFVINSSGFDGSPSSNFLVNAADHIFEQGWFFRVSGDLAESFFPVPDTQDYTANVATLDWADVNTRGFAANVVATLKSGISPSARVQLDLTITNNSGTQLDIDLFHLADFDLQPFISNDSATLANANDYIQVTTAGNENTAEYRAPGANAFLVRPFGTTDLGNVLSDALPTNFDNTGLPFGPGDFTGGFQFTRSIANGDSTTVSVILAVNETANSLVEACILPDLSCSVLSETDCTTATGVYFPDATCVDSDSDGRADIADNCPADPNKVDPDVCGCGVADTDTDSDGTLDCNDPCLADPNKVDPGVCGCGVADTDTDGDGVFICNDGCPDDANKAAPGVCGCGVADLDSDGDGSLDCNDECPLDAAKLAAGSCGCGVGDVDANSNGALDCLFNEELKARLNSALALLNSVKFPNNTKKLKAQRKIVSSLLVLSTDTTSYFETNANSFSLIESVANGGGISEPQSELGKAQKKLKRLRRKLTSEKKTFLRAKKAARKNLQKVIGQFA